MNKKDEVSDQLYSKIRSIGAHTACLYCLIKLHPYDQYYHFWAARTRTLTKGLQSFLTITMEPI